MLDMIKYEGVDINKIPVTSVLMQTATHKKVTCVFDQIAVDGYTPIKRLSGGLQGEVFSICKESECKYILKTWATGPGDFELYYTTVAAEHGVGAPIYKWGTCDGTAFLLMRRLESSLSNLPFGKWTVSLITSICNKYIRLYRQTGILQEDMKADNVVVSKTGEPYLIDYGLAEYHGKDNITTMDPEFLTFFWRTTTDFGFLNAAASSSVINRYKKYPTIGLRLMKIFKDAYVNVYAKNKDLLDQERSESRRVNVTFPRGIPKNNANVALLRNITGGTYSPSVASYVYYIGEKTMTPT
jgi:hypothetical protein